MRNLRPKTSALAASRTLSIRPRVSLAVGILASFGLLAVFPISVDAAHCDDLRRDYAHRLDRMEARYRHSRKAMYDAYECHRDRIHDSLRKARRCAGHDPIARSRIAELKAELKFSHRNVHERMDALECRYRDHRKAVKRERDVAVRACRNGTCNVCCKARRPVAPNAYHERNHVAPEWGNVPEWRNERGYDWERRGDTFRSPVDPLDIPGPRYLPNGTPPLPTPDAARWNRSHHHSSPRYTSTPDWMHLVSLLLR